MGLFRWLTRLSFIPGEPADDRTRKELFVPVGFGIGLTVLIWLSLLASSTFSSDSEVERVGDVASRVALVMGTATLLPATTYVVVSKRLTTRICEVTVLCCAAAVIVADLGEVLRANPTVIGLNVLSLDFLLLCGCSDHATKSVVAISVAWLCARSVLSIENVDGIDDKEEDSARFSFTYILNVVQPVMLSSVVLGIDFRCTRGFANSMREQKRMVDASVQLSEHAATLLSRYETESTRALLLGADGEQLPPLLRDALLQLVANLAMYRPYLPQSCLPGDCGDEREAEDMCEDAKTMRDSAASSVVRTESNVSQVSTSSKQRALFVAETQAKKVSLVAVNATSFLVYLRHKPDVAAFLRSEIEAFVGAAGAERGIVDFVCADRMVAHFNASRMCTTHRLCAARIAWSMATRTSTVGPAARTACACSGAVHCGDFGTSEVRRYMLLGGVFNAFMCLERVAARLSAILVDDAVAADTDVGAEYCAALVERLSCPKRGPKPFLVWKLTASLQVRECSAEWMYELARRAPNPHQDWNRKLQRWLNFGAAMVAADMDDAPFDVDREALTSDRVQSALSEAAVVGGTVSFATAVECVDCPIEQASAPTCSCSVAGSCVS